MIGPIAASARDLLGDYSHLLHIETLAEMRHQDNAFGFPLDDEVVADGRAGRAPDDPRRDRHAFRRRRGPPRRAAAGLRDGTDGEIEEAVELPRDGRRRDRRPRRALGPHRRCDDRRVPRSARASGSWAASRSCSSASSRPGPRWCWSWSAAGRWRSSWAAEHCAAVLLAWVPGDAGPEAIADVLVGAENPGGKLPISMPRNVGPGPRLVPPPPDRRSIEPEGAVRRRPHDAAVAVRLRPVVHDASSSRICASIRTRSRPTGGEVVVTVDVTNTGERRRATRSSSSTSAMRRRPSPGRSSSCAASAASASSPASAGRVRSSCPPSSSPTPGPTIGGSSSRERSRSSSGSSSADLPLTATMTLVGPTVHLVERNRYLTGTTLG